MPATCVAMSFWVFVEMVEDFLEEDDLLFFLVCDSNTFCLSFFEKYVVGPWGVVVGLQARLIGRGCKADFVNSFPTGNLITKRYFRTSEWGFLRDTCHVTWSSLFYLKLLRAQVGIWRHSYNRFIQLLLHNYTQHTRTVSRRWMWTFLMRNNTIKQLFSELNKKTEER